MLYRKNSWMKRCTFTLLLSFTFSFAFSQILDSTNWLKDTLPNGMAYFIYQDTSLDLLDLKMSYRCGVFEEPESQAGISDLVREVSNMRLRLNSDESWVKRIEALVLVGDQTHQSESNSYKGTGTCVFSSQIDEAIFDSNQRGHVG